MVDACWTLLNLAVVQYASKEYQCKVGESRTGVEIKHDELFATTGNLWIEVAEKAKPRDGDYAPSGIMRADNTWLYVIGNYDIIFLFAKKLLQLLSHKKTIIPNKTKTSLGYLLPEAEARKYAAAILAPLASEKIEKWLGDLHAIGKELHDGLMPENANQLQLFQ